MQIDSTLHPEDTATRGSQSSDRSISQGDTRSGLLPPRPGRDVLPPGVNAGAGGDQIGLARLQEQMHAGQVVQVRQRELTPRQVLVRGQACLVHVQHLCQLLRLLLHYRLVGSPADHRQDEKLEDEVARGVTELV